MFANLARHSSCRQAAEHAAPLAAQHGLPPPSKASIAKWHKLVIEAEKAALAVAAAEGVSLSADAVSRRRLDALKDRRSGNGRRVPQDVVDSVAQFCEDMAQDEVSFQRKDIRVELLATMEQLHAELCAKNGGWFTASDAYLRSFELQKGWSRRKVSTGGRDSKLPEGVSEDDMRELFKVRMASIVHRNGPIPPDLVVGADETGIHLIPSSSFVLAKKGSKTVARRDSDDKRQVTVMVSHSMAGDMLPLQLVFAGKTRAVLPKLTTAELEGTVLSHSASHWSTAITIVQWLKGVVAPYLFAKKIALGLPADAACLLVWDVFWAHRDVGVRNYIAKELPWLHLLFVPARCTPFLQVCDVSINKPLKSRVEDLVRAWRIEERKQAGTLARSLVALRKQVSLALIKVNKGIEPAIIRNGVRSVGVQDVWNPVLVDALLETAQACEADNSLWVTISRGDHVCRNGAPTENGDASALSSAGAASPPSAAPLVAAQPAPVTPKRGTKRPRQYTCGYCKEDGHTASACKRALAGLPAHKSARRSVRERWRASPGVVSPPPAAPTT